MVKIQFKWTAIFEWRDKNVKWYCKRNIKTLAFYKWWWWISFRKVAHHLNHTICKCTSIFVRRFIFTQILFAWMIYFVRAALIYADHKEVWRCLYTAPSPKNKAKRHCQCHHGSRCIAVDSCKWLLGKSLRSCSPFPLRCRIHLSGRENGPFTLILLLVWICVMLS